MIVYATSSDYTTGPPARIPPANIDALLWSASLRVAKAANRNPYNDTPAPADVAPLRDATTAQAAAWAALGVNPDAGGLDVAPIKRTVLLDATIEQDTSGQGAALQAAAADLCSEARDILQQAGILWQPVPLGDQANVLYRFGMAYPPDECYYPPSGYWYGAEACRYP